MLRPSSNSFVTIFGVGGASFTGEVLPRPLIPILGNESCVVNADFRLFLSGIRASIPAFCVSPGVGGIASGIPDSGSGFGFGFGCTACCTLTARRMVSISFLVAIGWLNILLLAVPMLSCKASIVLFGTGASGFKAFVLATNSANCVRTTASLRSLPTVLSRIGAPSGMPISVRNCAVTIFDGPPSPCKEGSDVPTNPSFLSCCSNFRCNVL